MNTTNTKTLAYLISNNRPVAVAKTAAKNGDKVAYGFDVLDNCIHQLGWAKVSRAKKWAAYDAVADSADMLPVAFVNYGGGAPF